MRDRKELLRSTSLFVFDFDETLAATSEASPNGLNVVKAYALALDEIFGVAGLLEAVGGLQNRAPSQLIQEVLRKDASLAEHAKNYYAYQQERLSGLVLPGKGVDMDSALTRGDELGFCAELLVREKLALLHKEQGEGPSGIWPAPCKGAAAFLQTLGDQKWGIISSGHEMFIAATLRLWELSYPALSVTDDDLRGLSLPVEAKSKPSPYLFDVLLGQAASQGLLIRRDRILFIGDDPDKDGGLAQNAGVNFLWYNQHGKASREGMAEFGHWNELTAEYCG